MKNLISRDKTTEAYDRYAEKIFQLQIELRIDDEAFDFDQGVVSEINLRKAIANHLGAWLRYDNGFYSKSREYIQTCKDDSKT